MNIRTFTFPIIYSTLCIVSICIAFYGGPNIASFNAHLKFGSENSTSNSQVIGADENYLTNKGYELEQGRNFSPQEIINGSNLIIIKKDVEFDLFKGKKIAIDKFITIGSGNYKVIGVIASKRNSMGLDGDNIIPLNNAHKYFSAKDLSFNIYRQQINKVSIIGWLLIIPFCVMAMIYAKKTQYNNSIGGKDAVKEGFKFIVFSTILLVIFQAIFFTLGFKDYKINFIQTYGVELAKAQILQGHLKITAYDIDKLIQQEIEQITLFKECTSIVFKNLFLGTITAIVTAVTIRGNFKF